MIDKFTATASAVILEALLTEGEEKVAKLVKRGKTADGAALAVARSMDLTVAETEALRSRVNAANEPPAPAAPAVPEEDCLFFDSAEDAEQAAGVLMYNGVPWKSKDSSSRPYIHFESAAVLQQAKGALKRRWDFVENSPRKVAVIEFDNLGDYERVLEFMSKQSIALEYRGDETLSEDAVEAGKKAAASSKPAKGKKAVPFDEGAVTADRNNYRAVNRANAAKREPTNVWEDSNSRVVCARKRWR